MMHGSTHHSGLDSPAENDKQTLQTQNSTAVVDITVNTSQLNARDEVSLHPTPKFGGPPPTLPHGLIGGPTTYQP